MPDNRAPQCAVCGDAGFVRAVIVLAVLDGGGA